MEQFLKSIKEVTADLESLYSDLINTGGNIKQFSKSILEPMTKLKSEEDIIAENANPNEAKISNRIEDIISKF